MTERGPQSWPEHRGQKPSTSPLAQFRDRAEAGERLAERLIPGTGEHPIIVALPRGGIPVAVPIAKALAAPLEILSVRKLGAPQNPELAIGAIVDADEPFRVLNDEVIAGLGIERRNIHEESARQLERIKCSVYRNSGQRLIVEGRSVILVDDGIATGVTARAAIIALRRKGAARITLAVPVAPIDTLAKLELLADAIVCLRPASDFRAVSFFYQDFHQVANEEALGLLATVTVPPQASSN